MQSKNLENETILENEIIDVLKKRTPNEVETKEVIEQIKETRQNTPSSKIKSAILTLIDDDRIELTQNMCLKFHT